MSEQDKVRLREMLLNQRQEIFEQYQRFEFDLQALGERDIEMEEEAQKADEISLLDQLVERDKDKLEEIDLALFRMAAGNYGTCESWDRGRCQFIQLEVCMLYGETSPIGCTWCFAPCYGTWH